MNRWTLRTAKIAPGVTLAVMGVYTAVIFTDQNVASPQLNSVILAWLGIANVLAFGCLALALVYDRLASMRLDVESLRWSQPMPVASRAAGTVYPQAAVGGALSAMDDPTVSMPIAPKRPRGHRGRRRQPPEAEQPLKLVVDDVRLNGSTRWN